MQRESDGEPAAGVAPIETGTLAWFNLAKQFGFVALENGRGDAFLYMKVLKRDGYV